MPQKLSQFFGKTLTSSPTTGINTTGNLVTPQQSVGNVSTLPTDNNAFQVIGNAFISGNLGIGTTAGSNNKLDVGGNTRVVGFVSATDGFNIGIQSTGSVITTGLVTAFNFVGSGNTFLYNPSTKTVDISISSGNNLSISTSTTTVPQDIAFVGGSTTSVIGIATVTNRFVYVPSTGNVGVGTTNATNSLTVTGTGASISQLYITGVSTFINGPILIGSGTSTGTASQPLQVTGGLFVAGSASTTGAIGVGTTNPGRKLHVFGDASTNPFNAAISITNTNTTGFGAYLGLNASSITSGRNWHIVSTGSSDTAGVGKFAISDITAGADRLVIDSFGNTGIGTTNPLGTLQVGNRATVGSGSSIFIVSGIGSVGVGTTNPRFQMHIVGVGTTALFVVGESQITRVAITTTSSNTLTLEAGRTYIYYAPTTLTLPASPTAGDRIELINRSGITTAVLARNGQNIMGLAENLDLDVLNGAFTVTYSNVTDGWVIGR